MKDVLMITNYWHFECEKASSRYLSLANLIADSGMNLEIITSTFYHATKTQRSYDENFLNSFAYKVTLIHETGYSNNVSIKRILSHRRFSRNILKYIKKRKKPDLIYCVVPSLDVAEVVTKYSNINGIKVIIDIQDLWPEAYKMVLNIPIISEIIFLPMKRKADKIYALADEIVAVSQTYVNRALEVSKKCKEGNSVFIGTELSSFDRLNGESKILSKPKDEIWIAYIGTLGYSYDIPSIIDALEVLKVRGVNNIKFVVMGDGPLRKKFEKKAKGKAINYEFTGRLHYSEMVKLLSACDIAVNPIVSSSVASIINKVGDYAAAGLPVINTQECDEYKELLVEYAAGFNCRSGFINEIAEKINKLSNDEALRKEMGKNSRKLAEDKFDRKQTYHTLVDVISGMNEKF